jgi:hypothetical protein
MMVPAKETPPHDEVTFTPSVLSGGGRERDGLAAQGSADEKMRIVGEVTDATQRRTHLIDRKR